MDGYLDGLRSAPVCSGVGWEAGQGKQWTLRSTLSPGLEHMCDLWVAKVFTWMCPDVAGSLCARSFGMHCWVRRNAF
jgi:hypothetical protein